VTDLDLLAELRGPGENAFLQIGARLAELGTSCPDHFLRTKIAPLVVPFDPVSKNLDTAVSGLDKAIADYRADYAAYYERCKRLDSPKMRAPNAVVYLAPGDYLVADVLETVRASLQSLALEKGLEFETAVEGDIPLALGDGKRITQCLMNLVGNALKFSKYGRVTVRVKQQGENLLYRVSDTGIGIPKEELENIFVEFQQLDTAITREFSGTGLGLNITKKFVEMHGGRIWVESELGRGSTFFFSIPLRMNHVEAAT